MLYCRDTARLRHYSLSFSAFLSFLYLPSSLFSAPLRCAALRKRQARSRRDLVTLLPVMSRVRSTFLSAPVAPPALLRRETRTRERTYTQLPYIRSHAVYLLSSRSSSRLFLSLSLFPSFLFLSALLSLSLSGVLALVVPLCRYKPYVTYITPRPRASCSPPWPGPAIQIGEVPAPLHEITSLLLDFTFAENMPV